MSPMQDVVNALDALDSGAKADILGILLIAAQAVLVVQPEDPATQQLSEVLTTALRGVAS